MKMHAFHRFVYKALWHVLKPFIVRAFNFKFDVAKPMNHPFMVLANHVTNYDPLLVGLSFPQHMYFVASEHLFRIKVLSSILKFIVAPIVRVKAKTERHTALSILRTLKNGYNVCMFPEGSTTWSGETGEITEATAKLVKASGSALITYRLTGGFFTAPRWGKSIRKGAMEGRIVREYSPEELKEMTDEELYTRIKSDLYVNAYEDNAVSKISFRGKDLAEFLETALFVCPNCQGIGTLKSQGDVLSCRCGLKLRYTELGFFESLTDNAPPFTTVLEWDRWQRKLEERQIETYTSLPEDTPITSDRDQKVFRFETRRRTFKVGEGMLYLYKDRLVLEDKSTGKQTAFLLQDITDMAVIQRTLLTFSVKGKEYFEIKSDHPRSPLKYLLLCKALTDMRVMI